MTGAVMDRLLLRIGPDATTVARSGAGVLRLPVGWSMLAAGFRAAPPSESDIERAIDGVEQAIGRAPVRFEAEVIWEAEGHLLAAFAAAAGLPQVGGGRLAAAAVENLFTRLAEGAYRSVPKADALPADPAFSATLVLLRELMHHCAIPAVVLSGLFEARKIGEPGGADLVPTLIATFLAFVVGYASIAWMLRWLTSHSTAVFVVYRVVLGSIVLLLTATGAIS